MNDSALATITGKSYRLLSMRIRHFALLGGLCQSLVSRPASAESDQRGKPPVNPYESTDMPWTDKAQAPTSEKEGSVESDSFIPETPFDEVQDTEHIVPTSFNNEDDPEGKDEPFTVGGIMVQLADDVWFKFYGFFQLRYIGGQHETPKEGRISGGGFSLARARVFFRGHLTRWMGLLLRVGARSDGSVNVEQAYADFRYRQLTLRVGQWYLPLFQEQFLSPVSHLALNSSAVGSVFDGGQTQGARLLWSLDTTHLQLAVSDGMRSGFSEVGSSKVADVALTFRAEHALGRESFVPFSIGSSFRDEKWGALFGIGGHYQSGGELQNDAVELASGNGDITLKGHGINLHMSASYVVTEGEDSNKQLIGGMVGQGGVFVHDVVELYARYEVLLAENDAKKTVRSLSLFRGLTGGVNYYFWPDRGLRVQSDFIYYFDPSENTPLAYNPNAGLFKSSGPQWTWRTQLNVLF